MATDALAAVLGQNGKAAQLDIRLLTVMELGCRLNGRRPHVGPRDPALLGLGKRLDGLTDEGGSSDFVGGTARVGQLSVDIDTAASRVGGVRKGNQTNGAEGNRAGLATTRAWVGQFWLFQPDSTVW